MPTQAPGGRLVLFPGKLQPASAAELQTTWMEPAKRKEGLCRGYMSGRGQAGRAAKYRRQLRYMLFQTSSSGHRTVPCSTVLRQPAKPGREGAREGHGPMHQIRTGGKADVKGGRGATGGCDRLASHQSRPEDSGQANPEAGVACHRHVQGLRRSTVRDTGPKLVCRSFCSWVLVVVVVVVVSLSIIKRTGQRQRQRARGMQFEPQTAACVVVMGGHRELPPGQCHASRQTVRRPNVLEWMPRHMMSMWL